MEFCEKCGAIMMAVGAGSVCAKCGHKKKGRIKIETKEKIDVSNVVAVVDKKKESVHPITDYECGKCGNKRAFFWIRQMRAGDEPESKFYKCTKCENTVRVDN